MSGHNTTFMAIVLFNSLFKWVIELILEMKELYFMLFLFILK